MRLGKMGQLRLFFHTLFAADSPLVPNGQRVFYRIMGSRSKGHLDGYPTPYGGRGRHLPAVGGAISRCLFART